MTYDEDRLARIRACVGRHPQEDAAAKPEVRAALRTIRNHADADAVENLPSTARCFIVYDLFGSIEWREIRRKGDVTSRLSAIIDVADAMGDEEYAGIATKCAAYAPEIAGGWDTYRRMLLSTVDRDRYYMLLPDSTLRQQYFSERDQPWTQEVRRTWLARAKNPNRRACDAINAMSNRVRVGNVYTAFAELFDDPVREMIAVGGFAEAADIVFAASRLSMKRLHTSRAVFIRTAVAAREDGAEELDWFLRLALKVAEEDGVTLGFEPDIDYVRNAFVFPKDFVDEDVKARGSNDEDFRVAFKSLVDAGWKDIEIDFGMSRYDGSYEAWRYADRSLAIGIMHELARMPDGFAKAIRILNPGMNAFSARAFVYPTAIVDKARTATPHGVMTALSDFADADDPQRLYRWIVSCIEQRFCVSMYRNHVIYHGQPSSRFLGTPSTRSRGHLNRRPPVEAVEYVENGVWPRTFTYGRDVLLVPDLITDTFGEVVPGCWEDAAAIDEPPKSSDPFHKDDFTISMRMLNRRDVKDLIEYLNDGVI